MIRSSYIDTALRVVKSTSYEKCLRDAGVPKAQWELALGDKLWSAGERNQVRNALDSLLFSGVDCAGLPRANDICRAPQISFLFI